MKTPLLPPLPPPPLSAQVPLVRPSPQQQQDGLDHGRHRHLVRCHRRFQDVGTIHHLLLLRFLVLSLQPPPPNSQGPALHCL